MLHTVQHLAQHVAQHVEPNVGQQFAAFNTYKALCKFVACNTQQNRTFPILLSNKFKTTNKNRASEHVTRRVSFDEERNVKFIDEFKAAAPCLWGVARPDCHHGEVRNCDM